MGDVRRGFSFVFYLSTAWRTAAAIELRFKTLSAHLHTFTKDALIIHRPLAVHLGTSCSLSFPTMINWLSPPGVFPELNWCSWSTQTNCRPAQTRLSCTLNAVKIAFEPGKKGTFVLRNESESNAALTINYQREREKERRGRAPWKTWATPTIIYFVRPSSNNWEQSEELGEHSQTSSVLWMRPL